MPGLVKDAGAWKEFDPSVKDAGAWKEVLPADVRDAGAWKTWHEESDYIFTDGATIEHSPWNFDETSRSGHVVPVLTYGTSSLYWDVEDSGSYGSGGALIFDMTGFDPSVDYTYINVTARYRYIGGDSSVYVYDRLRIVNSPYNFDRIRSTPTYYHELIPQTLHQANYDSGTNTYQGLISDFWGGEQYLHVETMLKNTGTPKTTRRWSIYKVWLSK